MVTAGYILYPICHRLCFVMLPAWNRLLAAGFDAVPSDRLRAVIIWHDVYFLLQAVVMPALCLSGNVLRHQGYVYEEFEDCDV